MWVLCKDCLDNTRRKFEASELFQIDGYNYKEFKLLNNGDFKPKSAYGYKDGDFMVYVYILAMAETLDKLTRKIQDKKLRAPSRQQTFRPNEIPRQLLEKRCWTRSNLRKNHTKNNGESDEDGNGGGKRNKNDGKDTDDDKNTNGESLDEDDHPGKMKKKVVTHVRGTAVAPQRPDDTEEPCTRHCKCFNIWESQTDLMEQEVGVLRHKNDELEQTNDNFFKRSEDIESMSCAVKTIPEDDVPDDIPEDNLTSTDKEFLITSIYKEAMKNILNALKWEKEKQVWLTEVDIAEKLKRITWQLREVHKKSMPLDDNEEANEKKSGKKKDKENEKERKQRKGALAKSTEVADPVQICQMNRSRENESEEDTVTQENVKNPITEKVYSTTDDDDDDADDEEDRKEKEEGEKMERPV
ncbi:glutamic acid-rich protein [Diachasma alloeum]|uniref:glutamic acid-rich protein n=1 Tax=Diachasma alloeum TaxID=454923 RepID=UPI00073810D4|nr:glutamic acid-rich protein [Diachasma alloeum]